jgi:hypothetical protein
MTDQLSWSAVGEWLAGFVPESPARTAVLVVECLRADLASFDYRYYVGVPRQGAASEGSLERQHYDRSARFLTIG